MDLSGCKSKVFSLLSERSFSSAELLTIITDLIAASDQTRTFFDLILINPYYPTCFKALQSETWPQTSRHSSRTEGWSL